MSFCIECAEPLTADELRNYEYRCERCETINHELLQLWRHGKREDAALDARYSVHVESADCWCKPVEDVMAPGLWIHNEFRR